VTTHLHLVPRSIMRGARGWEGVDWMHLDQDMVQWWAHVNTVMNLWVP
jgi:hypothetical protein